MEKSSRCICDYCDVWYSIYSNICVVVGYMEGVLCHGAYLREI